MFPRQKGGSETLKKFDCKFQLIQQYESKPIFRVFKYLEKCM